MAPPADTPTLTAGATVTLPNEVDEFGRPTVAIVVSPDPLKIVRLGKAVDYGLDVTKV